LPIDAVKQARELVDLIHTALRSRSSTFS
jgi:hypothetical protein